ncbi:MAG: CotH kinase family protein [Flavobacteriaceae bacterium]|nr:CotH kinase family protein [Flavobacteriaceae bacterium]
MRKFKIAIILIITIFFFHSQITAQDIRINEVVSSNSVYLDEDGDTPDWIELYNFGDTEISLLDWGLSDDVNSLSKWKFPNVTVQPNEYLWVWASSKDRSDISYVRTLINQGDSFKYFSPVSEPSSSWKNLNFDDDSWLQGPSGFGYADGDDATIVPNGTKSVYTRIKFDISDIDNLINLILDVDYDDGFVAYINGIEVARANINGTPPLFDAGALVYHEAQMYDGGKPERFFIDNPSSILNDGENILSIQLHNLSETSSDLSLIPFLSVVFSSPNSIGVDPPEILGLVNGKLHTNFKVSSKSETLTLSDPQENIVYQILVEGLHADVSMGTSINNDDIVYYIETTPGLPNSANEYVGIINADIIFSNEGGIINSAINLTLSGNETNQVIRYTTDATLPNETSTLYTSSISITSNSTVRARLFASDFIPSLSNSKTYIFNANHQIDIVTLTTDPYNFFDEDYGIYVYGDSYDSNTPHFGANFWEDWERPVHFSFYDKDTGELGTEFNAGIKIFGGWSRANDQRSLSIFARGQYGTSEMEYPFFDNLNYDKFQAIVLRNSGNDWLKNHIKDISLTSLMEGSGLDYQSFNPVATYLNGEYWGMYNLREKTNEHMLASKHNVDADKITLLEGNGVVIEGSNEEYLELINYVENTDLTNDANFIYVSDRVDITNYALYQVAQIFFNNTDWPGNNIKFWNHPEGKWRWILYDTDFGFGPHWNTSNYNEDTLSFALEENGPGWPNPPWSTLLFRNLMENIGFRNIFINRYADELNTRFLSTNVKNHIESVFQMVEPEIQKHYTRWGGNPDDARYFVNEMKIFADKRPYYAKKHIKDKFSLPGNMHTVTIVNNDISQSYVKVNNNLKIQSSSWNGYYFETVPIELKAVAEAGFEFSHWTGASSLTDATIELNLVSDVQVTPIFIVSSTANTIVINEINYKSSDDFDPGDWVELYNPNNEEINVSNWILKDDDNSHAFNFPDGTIISAEGFLILTKKESDFSNAFPDVTNVIGDFDFGLGSKNDAVRLYNSDEVLQDEVYYSSNAPWPECAKGQGPTLELVSPELDNSLPENWNCINAFGSPGKVNDLQLGIDDPSIKTIELYPNPVSNILKIKGSTTSDLSVIIYNVLGEEMLSKKGVDLIDLSSLTNGIYFVLITDGIKNSSYKLIKN